MDFITFKVTKGDEQNPHNGLVFPDKKNAELKDLSSVIGRVNPERKSIVFLKDNQLGTKYEALERAGLAIHLAKDNNGNYYITNLVDNLSDVKQYTESIETDTDVYDSAEIDDVEADERDELVYKEEKDFLEQDIDSAMDLNFSMNELNYDHRVGLYSEVNGSYTLRDDIKEYLEDFSFSIDENEEGVIANIDPKSINPRKLLMLIKLLKREEQEDEDELKEAIQADRVQVDCLPIVKSLLSRMRLAQKHGDIEESDEAEVELNELLSQYRESNPPAQGIEKVEEERDDILTKKEATLPPTHKHQNHNQAVARGNNQKPAKEAPKKKPNKKVVSTAQKTAKKVKHASLSECALSILEESGIQMRGQQNA